VINVRGESITVRELTYKQKKQWARAVQEDMYCAAYVLASMVCDPPVTQEEAEDWPAQVLEHVVEVATRLSGMDDKKEGDAEKNG
jgi:hypothetical protein